MSEGTARKVQPFTISTKLSLPKCSLDFPGESCPGISLAALDKNLKEESVPLSLAGGSPGPTGAGLERVATQEDGINPNSLSRSIKKIALSNWQREPGPGEEDAMLRGTTQASSERNCNNNNCRTGKAQFKVFLKKEGRKEEEKQEEKKFKVGDRAAPLHMIADSTASSPWKEGIKNIQASKLVEPKHGIKSSPGLVDLSKWSPLITQFNCDVMQAEKWVQGKLLDLKDGCSIQEWGHMTQTLQRDMKDFENTMIKLNQIGEQLMVQPNHSTEIGRRLQTLREQWQLLKQLATDQSKAVGGLRNLQEFNQKSEQLEAWIRQKEEKPLLAILLQEKADKIQLTRRILDLKQEEQQFQSLHEEMNSLAHKLEKQGKSESRSVMARRKHLNKMWLQVQGTMKEHYETLQLALEAATFLQQADVLLGAIHAKRRSLCGLGKQRELKSNSDLDVRDLASQVMMLDVTLSQLTSLHPSLVARVSLKHQDVKESWAQLQQLLRNEKPTLLALTRRLTDSPSSELEITTTTSSPDREPGEKTVWRVHKDILESMEECLRDQESNSGSHKREATASDNRRRKKLLRQANTSEDPPQQKKAHPQDFCQVADGKPQQLLHTDHRWSPKIDNTLMELEELWEELKRKHRENGVALKEIDTALQLVGELEEAECWLGTMVGFLSTPRATKKLDDLRGDLKNIGTLENQARAWSTKLQALEEEMEMESSSEHIAAAMIQRKMERVKERLAYVQDALRHRASDLRDSLILMEFLQNVQLEEMLSQRNEKQAIANQLASQESLQFLITQSGQQLSNEDMSRPLEELQEAVEMLNAVAKERQANKAGIQSETFQCFEQAFSDVAETRLVWINSHMETVRERVQILAQDITQAERSFAMVKNELDLLELEGLLKRQKEIESDVSKLAEDIEKLEKAVTRLEEGYLLQISYEPKRILEILESWKDLQKLVLQNAVHGQQAVYLQQFFRDYLAIISWTEDTRAQIFSESSSTCGLTEAQWKELENNMKTKLKEFEELATAGWKLVAEEHFLSETIKERLEELRSMLGWVMVHWHAQSSQKDTDNKNNGAETQDGILNKPQNHQVSTYLQMKEKDGDAAHGSSISRPPTIKQMPPRTYSLPLPSPGWSTAASQTLPKASSSCLLQSLKRKGKRKPAGDAHLLTLQRIMGTELKNLQFVQEKRHNTSSTWPPKNSRKAQRLWTPTNLGDMTDYMRNPLAQAIDIECNSAGETAGGRLLLGQNRGLISSQVPTEKISTCQHLSLGSVLSLQLPKDPTVLRNVHETIKVIKDGLAERKSDSHGCQVAHGSSDRAKVQGKSTPLQKRGTEGQLGIHKSIIRAGDVHSKDKGSTWFEEVSISPNYCKQKAYIVAPCEEDRQSPKSQSSSGDDFLDFKQNRLSRISVLHEQIGWEWDKLAASLSTTGSSSEVEAKDPTEQKAQIREASRVRLKPSPTKHTSNAGATSYTTQVKDSLANETPGKKISQSPVESFVRITPSLLPCVVKSPPKMSVLELDPQEASSESGPPILTSRGNVAEGPKSQVVPEMCHPAHELFEEEEEELQAIWSNVEKDKRSTGTHSIAGEKADKIQSPDNSGEKVVLTSADNVLIAKFRLPTPAQMLQRLEGERGTNRKNSPSQHDWASISSFQEQPERAEASPMGSLQSMCLLKQQKFQEEDRFVGKQLPSKLELQMMEGTLERKHLLQAGGKKANCRSWNSFHTVLMRQTLCFYQDKKDTLKSSAVAFPLNVSGAVCSLNKEYTKKNNCFTLQMKDGSKYLLRAPTEPLVKEWVIKLQQNSGLHDMDYFHSASQTAQEKTSAVSVIPGQSVSHFLGLHQPLATKNQEAILKSRVRMQLPYGVQEDPLDIAASQTGNVHRSAAIYTAEHSLTPCPPTQSARSQDPYICQEEEDFGLITNKRRSYSFTSATYQKISPLSVSKEPVGVGSSYSVTLYIGEQASSTLRPRCHSFVTTPGGSQETLGGRSQGDSPRQKNKSVFRKLFGKKD
ncbi:uncharacterized protein LOC121917799 isoform X5 [Sceloporus undulatus]|uniref:uncharacterized protein LOC121917799 isoform X5 n=1 Tax=Sceloporus undulatus TaxID=8520 RepID=UPI001C4CC635|nr:uncharacterized protein LOC121917799 isoform X5 [Sceloporus undulatus]